MPVQQQNSSFAARLGGRVAAANAEHADKPIDTGNRRLPPGVKGIAKLSTMYTKKYEDDTQGMKGETFFRSSANVVWPKEHNGETIDGLVTSQVIPLCDVPEKGQRKAKPFSENWFEFQNLFKVLSNGTIVCRENLQTDPTGARTEAFYFAAMKALTDPKTPVYIHFSTRGWTPPKTAQNPNPQEYIFETWHGLATKEEVAKLNGQHDPGAGMTQAPPPPAGSQPPPPPAPGQPQTQAGTQRAAAPLSQGGPPPQYQPPQQPEDREALVAALVEAAMNDPEGATEEGNSAAAQLEKLAHAAGWTQEQTANPPASFTNDWAGVGSMALTPPTKATTPTSAPAPTAPAAATPLVVVGSTWLFQKRTKAGEKLKDAKGSEFPPQNVEVTSVDQANKTCTVRTMKDGKDVVDIRSKKPVEVKWEWLEQDIPY